MTLSLALNEAMTLNQMAMGGRGVKFLIVHAHGLGVPQLKIDEVDNMVK